jgi:hypothetical protein
MEQRPRRPSYHSGTRPRPWGSWVHGFMGSWCFLLRIAPIGGPLVYPLVTIRAVLTTHGVMKPCPPTVPLGGSSTGADSCKSPRSRSSARGHKAQITHWIHPGKKDTKFQRGKRKPEEQFLHDAAGRRKSECLLIRTRSYCVRIFQAHCPCKDPPEIDLGKNNAV